MIFIKEVEQIVPLKIGFIRYNSQLTQDGMSQFAENNKENIEGNKYEVNRYRYFSKSI